MTKNDPMVQYGDERIPLSEAIKRAVRHNSSNPVLPAVKPYAYDPSGPRGRDRK